MTDITAHSEKWGDLPLLNDDNWVASDDDVESWSDLLYLRALVDGIEDALSPLLSSPSVGDQFAVARSIRAAEIFPIIELTFSEPWPDDVAADMLAAWRDGEDWPTEYTDTNRLGLVRTPFWALAESLDSRSPRPRWWRRTFHKRTARRLAAALAIAAIVIVGIGYATAPAKADPGVGCETIRWGLFGSQRRTVCDTPRRPDGSWTREREVWVPAGWVSGYCSGSYWVSCSQGYYRERGTVAYEAYVVTDATVLQDEPGWLPTGSAVIR